MLEKPIFRTKLKVSTLCKEFGRSDAFIRYRLKLGGVPIEAGSVIWDESMADLLQSKCSVIGKPRDKSKYLGRTPEPRSPGMVRLSDVAKKYGLGYGVTRYRLAKYFGVAKGEFALTPAMVAVLKAPLMRKEANTSAKRETVRMIEALAIRNSSDGEIFDNIARELGISRPTALNIFNRAMAKIADGLKGIDATPEIKAMAFMEYMRDRNAKPVNK